MAAEDPTARHLPCRVEEGEQREGGGARHFGPSSASRCEMECKTAAGRGKSFSARATACSKRVIVTGLGHSCSPS